jgi:hypothetical protein
MVWENNIRIDIEWVARAYIFDRSQKQRNGRGFAEQGRRRSVTSVKKYVAPAILTRR